MNGVGNEKVEEWMHQAEETAWGWKEQSAKRGRDGPFGLGRRLRQAEPQSGVGGRRRKVPPACLIQPCKGGASLFPFDI